MQFNYTARTQEGEIQEGTVEAVSREAAIDILQRHNLVIINIAAPAEVPFYVKPVKIFERVAQKEIVIFSRALSALFEAKVPMVEALRTLHEQTANPALKDVIFAVAADVEGGSSLSKAMIKHPAVFSHLYVSMIKSGETSGKLEEVLAYLADHLEREYAISSRAKGAMMYPLFILGTFVMVGAAMFIWVIPQLENILKESGGKLPFITLLVLGISTFIRSWIWLILILLAVAGVLFWRWTATYEGRYRWDSVKIRVPVFGPIWQKIYLARFASNLSTLITGGLPITQALAVTAEVVGNELYKRIILEAQDAVKTGEMISTVLKRYGAIPPMVTQMVAIGEKTGKVDQVLKSVASFYQRDVNTALETMVQLIEPILIVALGLMVGILVAAVLLPIYNIATSV